MSALDEYKRRNGRMFPTCSEVLEVIRDLGYEKRSEWLPPCQPPKRLRRPKLRPIKRSEAKVLPQFSPKALRVPRRAHRFRPSGTLIFRSIILTSMSIPDTIREMEEPNGQENRIGNRLPPLELDGAAT